MPDDDLRRKDDEERGFTRAILQRVLDGQKELKEEFQKAQETHRDTHADIYNRINGLDKANSFRLGRDAGIPAAMIGLWEAAKHILK